VASRPVGLPGNTDSFIREADVALYAAKANGRNCAVGTSIEALS
jgi:PleD family two-component response regulator